MAHRAADELIGALRANGARITDARRAICEVLAEAHDGHLGAAEIRERAVQVAGQDIDPSTVYRTIEVLEGLGVLHHVHLGHGPSVVHFADQSAHHHLVCRNCGTVIDVPIDRLAPLVGAVGAEFGFVVDGVHFALEGRCRDCQESSSF